MLSVTAMRTLIERWFGAALQAVEPAAAVKRHLQRDGDALVVAGASVPVRGRLAVLAFGKAARGMTAGAVEVVGDLLTVGLVITTDGSAGVKPPDEVEIFEAAHPVPDERGIAATRRALAMVDGLRAEDLLLVLISGGGSALFEAPRPPVRLEEIAVTTELLLRAGAPIQDLNAVRRGLSLVKGGGVRRAAAPAAMVTMILSDVLGNDPAVIASGPTVEAGLYGAEDGLTVLDRYGLRGSVPAAIVESLAEEVLHRDDAATALPPQSMVIVGDNGEAVAALVDAVAVDGRRAAVIWVERQGEAAALGREWVAACLAADPTVEVLLGGGEATVTVRGDGIGGRNTEFVLAAAISLEERGEQGWGIASLATDGQDGPTGVAGAIADGGTCARARAAGIDPVLALARNDSRSVFEAAGGLVWTGATGTNVNDLYVAVRLR